MDIIGVIASLIVIISAFTAFLASRRLYFQIGTEYFRYASACYLCFSIWIVSFVLQNLFNEPQYLDTLDFQFRVLNGFGWLALGFLFAAGEYANRVPDRNKIQGLFLITGVGIVFSHEPALYSVQLQSSQFVFIESPAILVVRAIFLLLGAVTMLPVILGITKTFRKFPARYRWVQARFSVLVFSGITALVLIYVYQRVAVSYALIPAAIAAVLFFLSMIIILERHPTLFFAARHDLVELIIIEKSGGIPVFFHAFSTEHSINPELISAFLTSARIAVSEALHSRAAVERFHFGEAEAIMHEGLFVFGIILCRRGSELLSSLLRLVIEEFEASYWFYGDPDSPISFKEFEKEVHKYFEFELPESL
ncbi:MAG: hypothetical protein RTU30_11620 [Candidatus Thorarchaeota archaeon]